MPAQLYVLTGMGGRYLATREAVRPLWVITTIRPALIFSAVLHTMGQALELALEGLSVCLERHVAVTHALHGYGLIL